MEPASEARSEAKPSGVVGSEARSQAKPSGVVGSEARSQAKPSGVPGQGEEVFALGAWLAKQRQLRGIRLEELAALTRLPVRSLERLEAGVYDGQQDGFVRGFVRTVAVAIGLDPEDAVARLLDEQDARLATRLPDLRRVAVAAVGLAGALALTLALWEFARAPAAGEGRAPETVLVRRDAVRALAVERGLLSEQPAGAGPPAVLLPEPLPAPAAEPEESVAPGPGPDAPLGAASLPASQAPPE
jgi:hypothetical protein